MPGRLRNVRVSIRPLTELTDPTWKTPRKAWTHLRYQRLEELAPASPSRFLGADRESNEAMWFASTRIKPAIPDSARVVLLKPDGTDDIVLEVVKVSPRGMRQDVVLKEITEGQP